jgi:hypothetical protein
MTNHPSAIATYRQAHDNMTLEAFGKLFDPPVDKATVLRWERGRITAERAVEVEAVTGIPRVKMRPDLFTVPKEAAE